MWVNFLINQADDSNKHKNHDHKNHPISPSVQKSAGNGKNNHNTNEAPKLQFDTNDNTIPSSPYHG
jgi:hypothetical protein